MGEPLRTIWCGNLAPDVVDEILYDLFLQAGPLEKVSIPKDRDGRIKGYGFITFKHECSVLYAIELMKGTSLFGRKLLVQSRSAGRADTSNQETRKQFHQRSASLQEPMSMLPPMSNLPFNSPIGSLPILNSLPDMYSVSSAIQSSLALSNPLLSMAGLYSGSAEVQGLLPQASHKNHQRSRSHRGADRYFDREDRGGREERHNKDERNYRNDRNSWDDRGRRDDRNGRDDRGSRDDRRDHHDNGGGRDRYRSRENDYHGRPHRSGNRSGPYRH